MTAAITNTINEKPFQSIIASCIIALTVLISSVRAENNIQPAAPSFEKKNDMRNYNTEQIKAMLCREKHETFSDAGTEYQIDMMSLTFKPDGTFEYQSGGRDNGDYFLDNEKSGKGTYKLEGPFTMMAGPGYKFDTYNYVRVEGLTADGTLIPMQLKQVISDKNPNSDWKLCNGDDIDYHEKYFSSFAIPLHLKK